MNVVEQKKANAYGLLKYALDIPASPETYHATYDATEDSTESVHLDDVAMLT